MMWCLILLAALLFQAPVVRPVFARPAAHEIRLEVHADALGEVRNDFGNVSVETWNNSYVAVSATFESTAKFTRSPIVIDNRGKLLTISVVRRATRSAGA